MAVEPGRRATAEERPRDRVVEVPGSLERARR